MLWKGSRNVGINNKYLYFYKLQIKVCKYNSNTIVQLNQFSLNDIDKYIAVTT